MIINPRKLKYNKNIKSEEYLILKTKFVYNSMHMDYYKEPSEMTFDNIYMLAEEGRVNGILKFQDILFCVNCLELFDYIIDSLDEPINQDYIKKCHEILTGHSPIDKVYNMSGKFKINNLNDFNKLNTSKNYNILEQNLKFIINNNDNNKLLNEYSKIIKFRCDFDAVKLFDEFNYKISEFLYFKLCLVNNLDIIIFDHKSLEYYNKLINTNLEFIIDYNEVFKLFEELKLKTDRILYGIGFIDIFKKL